MANSSLRSTGSGTVTFGMVSVPIKLYTAVSDESYSFTNIHAKCSSQVKMPKHCPVCDVDVTPDELTKAVKHEKDLIHFSEDDIKSLPLKSSKAIEIEGFIYSEDVPLLRLEKTYYAGPADEAGQKAFLLLHRAMVDTNKVAIARMARSGKESIVVLRPHGDIIVLSYLAWATEVRATEEIEATVSAGVTLSEAEVAMASLLVNSMPDAREFIETATDGYRDAVTRVLEAKLKGENVVQMPAPKPAAAADDLLAMLTASIAARQTVAVAS